MRKGVLIIAMLVSFSRSHALDTPPAGAPSGGSSCKYGPGFGPDVDENGNNRMAEFAASLKPESGATCPAALKSPAPPQSQKSDIPEMIENPNKSPRELPSKCSAEARARNKAHDACSPSYPDGRPSGECVKKVDRQHLTAAGLGEIQGEMQYRLYKADPPVSPTKTIIQLCGGPSACLTGRGVGLQPNTPPGYDVIIFDYPGLGENAKGVPEKFLNAEGAAKLTEAVVRSAGLQDYVLSGVSFGTQVATIAASRLGHSTYAHKPKSVLLDSPVGPSKPWRGAGEYTEQMSNPEEKAKFTAAYENTARAIGARHRVMLDMWLYMKRPEFQKAFVVASPRDRIACLSEWSTQNASEPIDAELKKALMELSRYMKRSMCDFNYDPKHHPIPRPIPITYLSGARDMVTPTSAAAAHANAQTETSRSISVFPNGSHGDFSMGAFGCSCDRNVWNSLFTSSKSVKFDTQPTSLKQSLPTCQPQNDVSGASSGRTSHTR